MKRIKYLALAALVGVWACSSDNTTAPEITGTISGTVSIEGTGANGITVTLSSGASTTTAGGGTYSFTGVPGGAYTVTISDFPSDVTFSSTSKAAAIQTAGQSVPVDFSGSYIRTASIIGSVTAGGTGIAGVSVAAAGPGGTQNKVTDANGGFNFTALRAGSYTVTISNIPANYNFTTTTQTVTVAAGATEQAQFAGTKAQDEVTASVVIAGLTDKNGATVNPSNVTELMNVKLQIDPGTNQLAKVCVLLDGVEVPNGCQTLSSAVAGMSEGPEAATVLEPSFTILTDAATDGTPSWLNGNHTLSARLDLTNATQANVSTSQTLTFNNADKIGVALTTDGKQATSSDGLVWKSGAVTVTASPVLYSGGTVSQVTFQLRAINAGGADAGATFDGTGSKTDTSAPFSVTWAVGDVDGTSGPLYAKVTATALADGTPGPTSPADVPAATAANRTNLDNVAPPPPNGWTVATGSNSWIGGPYEFSDDAPPKPTDPVGVGAVGGVTCAVHAGASNLSATNLLAAPTVAAGSDMTQSTTNTAYKATYNCWDKLENGKGKTTASTVAGNSFGVDLTNPVNVKYTASSPAEHAILGTSAAQNTGTYELTGSDALSGPGDNFGTIQLMDADGDIFCIVGDLVDDVCERVSDGGGGGFTTTTGDGDGYFMYEGAYRDLAGNAVEAPDGGRMAVFDTENPVVGNVTLPSTLPNGGSASFSAVATDNLDLMDFTTRTIYADGVTQLPYTAATMVPGAAFGALVQEAQMSQSVNFIRSIEFTAAAAPFAPTQTLYKATGQMFTARDWAKNSSENSNTFADGTVSNGSTADALGVHGWSAAADPTTVCVGTEAACGTTPAATDLTAVAKGLSGSFNEPFSRVVFYRVDGGVYTVIGQTSGGLADNPGAPGDPLGRTWTYSGVTFTATAADAGTVHIVAVGVDSSGDALISVQIDVTVNVP